MRRGLILLAVLSGCQFNLTRSLSPGDLRGQFVLSNPDGSQTPAAGAVVTVPGSNLTATADTNGRFVLRGMPPATYEITASLAGSSATGIHIPGLQLTAGDGLDLGTVVLLRLAGVKGTVQLNGEAVPGATVVLSGHSQVTTGTDGSFSFDGLVPVLSDNPGDQPQLAAFVTLNSGIAVGNVSVKLQPGTATMANITVSPDATLGNITGTAGLVNAATASITVTATPQMQSGIQPISVTVSASGHYEITSVPLGVYTITASAQGYASVQLQTIAVTAGSIELPNLLLTTSSADCGLPAGATDGGESCQPTGVGAFDVSSSTPMDGAMGVSSRGIVVDFTQPIDPTSVTSDTVQLLDASQTAVQTQVQVDPSDMAQLLIGPVVPLDAGATYTLELTTGIRGTNGMSLPALRTITFTTAPSTFQLVSSTPSDGATGVDVNAPLTAQFTEMPRTDTLAAGMTLLDASGNTVSGTTMASGNAAVFTPSAALTANAGYTWHVSTELASSLGNQLDKSYDIHFTTGPAVLQITAVQPASGSTNVPLGQVITLTFSDNVDSTTVTGNILLQGQLPVQATIMTTGNTVTITPASPLTSSTTYTITANTSVKSTSGQPLAMAYSSTFTTVPPFMVTLNPSNGSQVPVTSPVTVVFSQAMNPASINSSSVTVGCPTALPGTVTYDSMMMSATWQPSAVWLPYAGMCTLTVSQAVQTSDGLPIGMDYTSNFSTNARPVVQALATGAGHTCEVLADNTLWCYGANELGQLGSGDTQPNTTAVSTPHPWSPNVAVGDTHTCAIDLQHKLWCWGDRTQAQIGDGSAAMPGSANSPVQLSGTWSSVTAGGSHSCALDTSGALYCWGRNAYGECGQTGAFPILSPTLVSTGPWKQVSAGENDTCAVKQDNTLWCWGAGTNGELGTVMPTSSTPLQVMGATWSSVSVGTTHVCAVDTSNNLWCWGDNTDGQLGTPTDFQTGNGPTLVTTFNGNVTSVSAGRGHTCAISGGMGWCWGDNSFGQLGFGGSSPSVQTPASIQSPPMTSISAGNGHTCAISNFGDAFCWGLNGENMNGTGIVGLYGIAPAQESTVATTWLAVSAGGAHTCAIQNYMGTGAGQLWCWGDNSYGQLGDGTVMPQQAPELIGSATNWTSIAAGGNATCGIQTSGAQNTLWCWGDTTYAQAGIGSSVLVPTQVDASTNYVSVSVSQENVCASRSDGTFLCWGDQSKGQLGNGSTSATPLPFSSATAQMGGNVQAGGVMTCAGTYPGATQLVCAGDNGAGELGLGMSLMTGPPVTSYTPNALPSGQKFSLGGEHGCLLNGATVLCWGLNTWAQASWFGGMDVGVSQCGNSVWTSVSAGGSHTCAIANTGSLYCWGSNSQGQLGIGNPPSSSPTPGANVAPGYSSVSAGLQHTCGIKSDGTLWCWGDNASGQTGTSTLWTGVPSTVVYPQNLGG